MRQGDLEARERLVSGVYERLIHLSRKMLRNGSSVVQRWEQTEDLAHAAWFRIQRALEDEALVVQNDAHLFRLAARHLRFELIDLYRKHSGAQGFAANHLTTPAEGTPDVVNDGERFVANPTVDPAQLIAWVEFHEQVEALPEPFKAIVDLLWYQGLTQQEAAELLGVDVKTVKRRWREVKLRLADSLDSGLI
jgi:RNA polymerase sigma factor (sigma-70 family)